MGLCRQLGYETSFDLVLPVAINLDTNPGTVFRSHSLDLILILVCFTKPGCNFYCLCSRPAKQVARHLGAGDVLL